MDVFYAQLSLELISKSRGIMGISSFLKGSGEIVFDVKTLLKKFYIKNYLSVMLPTFLSLSEFFESIYFGDID